MLGSMENELSAERLRELLHYCLATGVFTRRVVECLRELLHFNPKSGVFTRRVLPIRNQVRVGDIAGTNYWRGYRAIRVAGRIYKAHRLAWLYVTGEWPKSRLDHINRDPSDNRFCNLREDTRAQNAVNSCVKSTSASGVKGAFARLHPTHRGKPWTSAIGGRHLGSFDTPGEAALAHATAAYGLYGEFAQPHWRDVLWEMRGTPWRKPQIEEITCPKRLAEIASWAGDHE